MKLWKKIVLLMLVTLMAAFALCGSLTIWQMWEYNIKQTTRNYDRELQSVSYTFEHFCQSDQMNGMSETVKNAWVKFHFQKCCGDGYVLLEDGRPVVNLTAYEVKDSNALEVSQEEVDYRIQKIGERRILLMKKTLTDMTGYEIMLVKDISGMYQELKGQILVFLGMYALISILAAGIVFGILRYTLRPLKLLRQAAVDISNGELDTRVAVTGKDELATVGEAFNQMADRIEQHIEELNELSERRKILVGSLTHEIKTPMTSIIGYSDTLLRVKVNEEQKERALMHIHRECRRLEKLSAKMLNLLGLYDNGAIELHAYEIRKLFERVEETEKYHLQSKGIQLTWECHNAVLKMDPELMESLLINLIDNAVKASEPGGRISLRGCQNVIQVEDEGRGIPATEIARVTEAFYMVDKSRSKKAGGLGLGLALCVQIAELHNARLEIDSEEGNGTVVSVIFSQP